MKILYIIDKMTQLAGIERILTCKMNYISEQTSHQVFLSTYDQNNVLLPFSLNEKISYIPFTAPIPPRAGHSLVKWIRAYLHARKIFKQEFLKTLCHINPDIVICTGYAYPVLDIIINSCQKKNIKSIMESHVMSNTISMKKNVYNPLFIYLFSFWDSYIMKSLQQCNCVVTLTNEDKTFWVRHAKRIEVIPNMITVAPQNVIDYRTKRVIAAGRYVSQKGYDLLIKAWHQINDKQKDWHLYIFGDGDRVVYKELVDQYDLNDNIHLLPATQQIVDEFAKSSIYVLSSRFEGFALVLLEAMSCGLPCISFDCPYGPRDIITNGEDGILVENGNIELLAKALTELMSDDSRREEMGRKAAKNISRYNPPFIMHQWINLFNSL